jgi:coproporphyrinogen III oxidase-like Fe-S oxidoreductase
VTRSLPQLTRALPYAPAVRGSLADWLAASAHHGYVYGYPHKTAYRALVHPVPIERAWESEAKQGLALYLHVPFCEFRCGFCNLFAAHGTGDDEREAYLDALERQASVVAAAIGNTTAASVAIGGGTPTLLSPSQLDRLLGIVDRFGGRGAPLAVETSPATATPDRIAWLRAARVTRVSLGVQTFDAETRRAIGRPDRPEAAREAAERLIASGIASVNLDLVYGAEGQTEAAFERDLEQAIALGPTELYLYPLYVRAQTGLGRRRVEGAGAADRRPAMLRRAVARLRDAGFAQRSMRSFVHERLVAPATRHRCEMDATIGLGPGARSYTRELHYADPWSVTQRRVRASVARFAAEDDAAFAVAHHGFELDGAEQQRRYVLQTLLEASGVSLAEHAARFGQPLRRLLPQIEQLETLALAEERGGRFVLTADGLAASDAIGPWLYSESVRARMAEHEVS